MSLLTNKISQTKGSDPTDEEIWKFLQCFKVLYFDLEQEGGKDITNAWNNLLGLVINRDVTSAQLLFDQLLSIVSEHNPTGGIMTYEKLKVKCSGIQLIENPNHHHDIGKLAILTQNSLDQIRDTIQPNIQFERTEQVNAIKNKLKTHEIVVLHGEPLVGKSVIMKKIALEYLHEGNCIWFSTDRMENNSLQSYLHQYNIDDNFLDIILSFRNIPKKCIFVDGLENATHENKRMIINDILVAVKTHNRKIQSEGIDNSFCWKIIITSRSTDLDKILINLETYSNIQDNTLVKMLIHGISDLEKEEVIRNKPYLNKLIQNSNLHELFSRPGILNLICYDNFPSESTVIKSVNSESQFMTVFWEHVICRYQSIVEGQGTPVERSVLMLKVAKKSLIEETYLTLDESVNANALSGLKLDNILDVENNRIFFVHDYVEDWAWAFLLKQDFEQTFGKIQNRHNSLRILTSLRLYSQLILDVEDNVTRWMDRLKFLESENDSPVWSDEWISSIVLSYHSETLLEKFTDKLIENENELFTKILRSLRLKAVTYDSELLQLFKQDEIRRHMHRFAKPQPKQWNYILKFAIENFSIIKGKHVLEFSNVVRLWTEKNKSDSKFRKDIYRISNCLAEEFFARENTGDNTEKIDYQDREKLRKNLANIIFNSCDILPTETSEFLRKYILECPHTYEIEDEFMENGWIPVAKELPEVFLEIMSHLLCQELTVGEFGWGDLHDLGINPKLRSITAILAPFYPFLKKHQEYGLRLIEKVVNHSTTAWRIREFKQVPRVQTLRLENRVLNLWGDELVFRWYRFPSLGSNTVTCALLALEKWLNEQIKEGVDPNPIITRLLLKTSSVAMVGLICSIALANPHRINKSILVSILENPVYWLCDMLRHQFDRIEAKSLLRNYLMMMMHDVPFLEKLANQPHREGNITQLVPIILCSHDTQLKERLVSAVKDFEQNIPQLYKKPYELSFVPRLALDTEQIKKHSRLWSLHADLDNWKKIELKGGIAYHFHAPDHFNEDDKRDAETAEESRLLFSCRQWAHKFLTQNKIDEEISIDQALDYTKKLIPVLDKKEDFTYSLAQDFIVDFVAALIVHRGDFVKEKDLQQWCKSIILDAAFIETVENRASINPEAFGRGVAACLPALYKQNKNNSVKKALDRFAVHPVDEVRHIFYNSLQTLWDFEPKLIWKYINILIKQSTNTGKIITCDPRFFYWSTLTSILFVIPNNEKLKENPDYEKLIKLLSDLLICTINCYVEGQKEDSNYNHWYAYGWNGLFFSVFANALVTDRSLQEEAIPKIFNDWIRIPSLMEEFLRQLALRIINKFNERSFELWTKICEKIVDCEDFSPSSYRSHTKEIVGMLLFHDPRINVNWKPENEIVLQRHIPFIHKWCEKFKNNSQSFAVLVSFLNNNGAILSYKYGISWLNQIIKDISDKQTFLKSSENTSELDQLLWLIWKNYREDLIQCDELFTKFSSLVYITAEYEKPYSTSIQDELKRISEKFQ